MQHSHLQVAPRQGFPFLLLTMTLWGTGGIAIKAIYAETETNALSLGFFRLLIALAVLVPFCWRTCAIRLAHIPRRELGLMLLMGTMVALEQVGYYAAISDVGVTVAVLVTICTGPLLVALLATTLLRERLTRQVVIALVLAIVGTFLLLANGADATETTPRVARGIALALGASLAGATMIVISRALAGRYHPLQPITLGFGAGATLLLPFALAAGLTTSYTPVGWALLAYMGIGVTALAYWLFLLGLRHTTATTASIVALLEPLISAALAAILFGERLSLLGLVGAALLIPAALVARQHSRH